tara:strand:+ start:43 stop:516 length:474 start_codon:yes stop_codon:yes gene_type:complete
MSWRTCYSGSNNIHHTSPAWMSDSRQFTNWNSICSINNDTKKMFSIDNNYNYRQFLINNAETIMSANTISANNCSSDPCKNPNNTQHDKHLFIDCNDSSMPYGYESTDLKNLYLSRKKLDHNLSGPILTQEQLLIRKSSQIEEKNNNRLIMKRLNSL